MSHPTNDQTKLFNQRVVEAQPVQRPISGSDVGKKGGLLEGIGATHSGTSVTTESGDKYLIHKGPDFTPSNPTSVTDANKSSNWKPAGDSYKPDATVGQMANNGDYKTFGANCHDATTGMPNSTAQKTLIGHKLQ